MPPRPSAVLALTRSILMDGLPEILRVLVLFSGGTVGGLLAVTLLRVAL